MNQPYPFTAPPIVLAEEEFLAWFPTDGSDDEMATLADPIIKFLFEGWQLGCRGPCRGRIHKGQFEVELIFTSESDARQAVEHWDAKRYLAI